MPLVCTIELSKTAGVTITVENADDKINQTVVMNGTSIVTTVKGNDATSKITQLQDQVKIEVKDFILEAETITCTSTKATSHKSEDVFAVESTKDMTLKSAAKLTEEAAEDVSIESTGGKVSLEASSDLTAKGGAKATLEAGTDATLKAGTKAAIKGGSGFEVKGPSGKVAADATLDVEGAVLNLKGDMESLKGSMIKIG